MFQLLAGFVFLLAVPANARAQWFETNRVVLTNAAQVRALTFEEASQHPAVHLQGVAVTQGTWMVLQDKTAGIYLLRNDVLRRYRIGDVLAVEGVADPGKFAPVVLASSVVKLGSGAVPTPTAVSFPQLQTGCFDAQLVEVTGVVRRSGISPEDPHLWVLSLALDGGELTVALAVSHGRTLAVDSEVRLRGVCFYQFNKSRQAVKPVLWMSDNEPVAVIRQAPDDPFNVTERPINTLFQFSAEDLFSHRVCVSGVVTHAVRGEGFWIHNGGEGLRVHSLQNNELTVGDQVKVLGFLSRGEYSPVLEDAIFRKQGRAKEPIPLRLKDMQQALDHDQDLVQLEARILEGWRVQDGCQLTLETAAGHFAAFLKLNGNQGLPRDWLPGSRVEIAGICLVAARTKGAAVTGVVDPGSFQILLRSPADITILQSPPWWTAERVGWLMAGLMGGLLAIGGVFFWRHRLRVLRQLAAIKAQAALAGERTRIARDLHDEIGANLTNISILSTLAAQSASDLAPATKQQCIEAASVAQQTIRAFDEILWSVNPKNDTLHSLSHYICRYAEETLGPAGISYRFELDETFPNLPLPPNCRHSLLLAVKEVLHNILKHAAAKNVSIKCGMETERLFFVRLTDDGCGMELNGVGVAPTGRQGLGLENLRHRLKELGGECLIESGPGKGTQVTFRLTL